MTREQMRASLLRAEAWIIASSVPNEQQLRRAAAEVSTVLAALAAPVAAEPASTAEQERAPWRPESDLATAVARLEAEFETSPDWMSKEYVLERIQTALQDDPSPLTAAPADLTREHIDAVRALCAATVPLNRGLLLDMANAMLVLSEALDAAEATRARREPVQEAVP